MRSMLTVLECPAFYVPVLMRETGQIEGPGKSVPLRGLEIGLFWFQPDRG
jgi:hypothetical protein